MTDKTLRCNNCGERGCENCFEQDEVPAVEGETTQIYYCSECHSADLRYANY